MNKIKRSLLILFTLAVAFGFTGALAEEGLLEQNLHEQSNVPLWGGLHVQSLDITDDYQSIDVNMPLPALPYMPRFSYHHHAYETETRFSRAGQSGGARSLQAHLPFGLTLEAGHRVDAFGRREDEFIGLTFRYSDLKWHNERIPLRRLGVDRGAPMPEGLRKNEGGGSFWRIAGSVALVAILAGGGGGGSSSSSNNQVNNNPIGADGWQLVWQDNFDGNALDLNKWNTGDSYGRDQCFGGGNNEQQCYTSDAQNISLSGGNLVLTALQADGLAQGRTYTSGRIQSNGKGDFTYGKFEARIKLPGGQGSWPAFWMLPSERTYGEWAASGEIDIVEAVNLGGTADNCPAPCRDIHGTLHFGGVWPENSQTPSGTSTLSDINAFHTYAVEWYPDEMRWFIDGTQYALRTQNQWSSSGAPGDPNAPFDQSFHMIFNLAIGGNWPGASDGQNFPRQMEVDYVRVYQCGGDAPSACKQ